MDAWTTFARTGRPSFGSPGSPGWPAYSAEDGRQTMVLDRACRAEAAPMEAERRFVEELLAASSRIA
jgi:carboxylesterase type B